MHGMFATRPKFLATPLLRCDMFGIFVTHSIARVFTPPCRFSFIYLTAYERGTGIRWRFGVALTAFGLSTKLLYVEPG